MSLYIWYPPSTLPGIFGEKAVKEALQAQKLYKCFGCMQAVIYSLCLSFCSQLSEFDAAAYHPLREKYGAQKVPSLREAVQFARQNRLKLFLDVKGLWSTRSWTTPISNKCVRLI